MAVRKEEEIFEEPFGPRYRRQEVSVDLTEDTRDLLQRTVVPEGEGNLYSSEIASDKFRGLHAPTLDLDLQCYLYESTTLGHYHLYIDKAIMWEDYANLLIAMRMAGLLQEGYVDLSLKRGATFLRKPWIPKYPEDNPDS